MCYRTKVLVLITKNHKIIKYSTNLKSCHYIDYKQLVQAGTARANRSNTPQSKVKYRMSTSTSFNGYTQSGSGTQISVTQQAPLGTSTSGSAVESIPEDPSSRDGSSNVRRDDTTVFVDDSNIIQRDPSQIAHIDSSILEVQDSDNNTQNIISFLEKPIILATGNFNITDSFSFLNSYSMPYAAFAATQAPIWLNKLSGVYGIRMDMRFRLVVNANRFQQGRYILGWVPLASPVKTTSALKEIAFNNAHMATLVQRTTVPHVELDLCNDTAAELVVPFVSTKSFYNMNSFFSANNENILGFVNLYPYSPMTSPAGSTVAGYTLYVSFENVRLFGAVSPQAGLSTKEVSNKQNGPVSSAALAISRGFKEFSHIPLLSSYATPISWIADRVASVASIFGWSKPTSGDSLSKVVLLQAGAHNTVDGDSDARPMSFLSKPGVVKMDGLSGTNYDEMDFSYIVRKPSWISTTSWTTLQTSGTILTTINVSPYQQLTIGSAVHFQPVAFVASFFQVWRGSLRFRLKFVRTEFHSGRIQIAFFPGDLYTAAANIDNAAYVHRMIVDIRETPECDFVVPYISQRSWSSLATGVIQISVTDPLVAPATVTSSISIIAEICGGEDFEVAMPKSNNYTPTTFVPQSGINTLTEMNIGNSVIKSNPILNSSLTIGDKVSNFRSYLKRFHPIYANSMVVATGLLLNGNIGFIYPDVIFGVNATPPATYIRADPVSTIASCYALWRGGVRVRNVIGTGAMVAANVAGPLNMKTYTLPSVNTGTLNVSVGSGTNTIEVPTNSHQHIQNLRNNSIVTVEVPQYSVTYARSVCDATNYQGAGNTYGSAVGVDGSLSQQILYFGVPVNCIVGITATQGQQIHNMYRALADDADFGCFISVPAMKDTSAGVGFISTFA